MYCLSNVCAYLWLNPIHNMNILCQQALEKSWQMTPRVRPVFHWSCTRRKLHVCKCSTGSESAPLAQGLNIPCNCSDLTDGCVHIAIYKVKVSTLYREALFSILEGGWSFLAGSVALAESKACYRRWNQESRMFWSNMEAHFGCDFIQSPSWLFFDMQAAASGGVWGAVCWGCKAERLPCRGQE